MLKKIKEFLVKLLPKLKKLIPTLHFSEAESVFSLLAVKIKANKPTDILWFITAALLCVCCLALTIFVVVLYLMMFS